MFRFTIRDVLWLTVVVGITLGLGLGWWTSAREQASSRYWKDAAETLAGHLEECGYQVEMIENKSFSIRGKYKRPPYLEPDSDK